MKSFISFILLYFVLLTVVALTSHEGPTIDSQQPRTALNTSANTLQH